MADIGNAASGAHEAVSEVVDAAVATADALAQNAIDNAARQIDAAHETAERIAEAATMSALGQQIEDLRRDFSGWLDELRQSLHSMRETLETRIAALETKAEAPTLLITSPPEQSLSTPAVSAAPTLEAPVTEVNPVAVVALAEAQTAPAPKKAGRRLI